MRTKKEGIEQAVLEYLDKRGKKGAHFNSIIRAVKCGVSTLYNRLELLETQGSIKMETRSGEGKIVMKIYRIAEKKGDKK